MSLRTNLLSSACVLAISAGAAHAQGLPAPAGGWAGGYVGALIGAGFSMNRFTDGVAPGPTVVGAGSYTSNPVGVALGLYAGYNWQVSPNGVLGIEADLTYNTASGSTVIAWTTLQAKAQFAGSLRVRAGVAMDRMLLYVTGGLAFGNPSVTFRDTALGGTTWARSDSLRAGFVVGAGAEYMVSRNWTVRFEALYYDFGSTRATDLTNTGYIFPTRSSQIQARVGASYRF
jgi:outer membrane immunogenic protein